MRLIDSVPLKQLHEIGNYEEGQATLRSPHCHYPVVGLVCWHIPGLVNHTRVIHGSESADRSPAQTRSLPFNSRRATATTHHCESDPPTGPGSQWRRRLPAGLARKEKCYCESMRRRSDETRLRKAKSSAPVDYSAPTLRT